jgi:hypothetical protein
LKVWALHQYKRHDYQWSGRSLGVVIVGRRCSMKSAIMYLAINFTSHSCASLMEFTIPGCPSAEEQMKSIYAFEGIKGHRLSIITEFLLLDIHLRVYNQRLPTVSVRIWLVPSYFVQSFTSAKEEPPKSCAMHTLPLKSKLPFRNMRLAR